MGTGLSTGPSGGSDTAQLEFEREMMCAGLCVCLLARRVGVFGDPEVQVREQGCV